VKLPSNIKVASQQYRVGFEDKYVPSNKSQTLLMCQGSPLNKSIAKVMTLCDMRVLG